MDNQVLIIVVAIGAAAIGLFIGLALGRNNASSSKQAKELETQLEASQKALEEYKEEVQQHFSDTAEAFKQASESYAALHQRVATGAQSLCTDIPDQTRLSFDTESPMATDTSAQEELPLEPPRDYAPKKKPDEKGVLNEDFGLSKNDSANDAA